MKQISRYDVLVVLATLGLSASMILASAAISRTIDLNPFSPRQLDNSSLERLTGVVIGLLGALILMWFLLGFIAAVLAAIGSRTGHHRTARALARLSPPFIARITIALFSGSLIFATSANATPLPQQQGTEILNGGSCTLPIPSYWSIQSPDVPCTFDTPKTMEETTLLSPGWVPQPISLPLQRVAGGTPRETTSEVIVQSGDSLWSIAAAHLGSGASKAQIAAAWPRWYEANKKIIGQNPDHLELGLVLQVPASLNFSH